MFHNQVPDLSYNMVYKRCRILLFICLQVVFKVFQKKKKHYCNIKHLNMKQWDSFTSEMASTNIVLLYPVYLAVCLANSSEN